MKTIITRTALALAASGMAVSAVPAAAVDFHAPGYNAAPAEDGWNRHRRDRHRDRYDDRGYSQQGNYGEPVYRETRVWRGEDGRTYCRKRNGTTGLIIGGAGGALLGRAIDTRGERTTGTVLGAVAGALIGREIQRGRSRSRCR